MIQLRVHNIFLANSQLLCVRIVLDVASHAQSTLTDEKELKKHFEAANLLLIFFILRMWLLLDNSENHKDASIFIKVATADSVKSSANMEMVWCVAEGGAPPRAIQGPDGEYRE